MKTQLRNHCLLKARFLLLPALMLAILSASLQAHGRVNVLLQDAQDRRVSGRVTTAAGETLPGVSIIVKGTATGTVTDVEGKYTISVPANGTLVFSSIGYMLEEVPVNGRSVINIR